jgi:hypothetical protein
MRLKACEVHGATAIAQRQQEWVAQRTLGRRHGHGFSFVGLDRESLPDT